MNLGNSTYSLVLFAMTVAGASNAADTPAIDVPSNGQVITKRPLTITIESSKELRSVIRQLVNDQSKGLRLTVRNLEPPDLRVGVRVYLGLRPDQDLPGIESEHYVGTFTFFPADDKEKNSFLLELSPSLRKLIEGKKLSTNEDIAITLVVTQVGGKGSVDEVRIPFEGLRLAQTQSAAK